VGGILKLATKYNITPLRQRIISHLEDDWPTTLDAWVAAYYAEERLAGQYEDLAGEDGRLDGILYDDRLPEPGSAIRLAQDLDVPSILPSAFYALSRIPIRYNRDGDPSPGRDPLARTARWALLDRQDLRNLLHGMQALARAYDNVLFSVTTTGDNTNCCADARDRLSRGEFGGVSVGLDGHDLLGDLLRLRDTDRLQRLGICLQCSTNIVGNLDASITSLWTSLPEYFQIAP
jgi:hypothetical protein